MKKMWWRIIVDLFVLILMLGQLPVEKVFASEAEYEEDLDDEMNDVESELESDQEESAEENEVDDAGLDDNDAEEYEINDTDASDVVDDSDRNDNVEEESDSTLPENPDDNVVEDMMVSESQDNTVSEDSVSENAKVQPEDEIDEIELKKEEEKYETDNEAAWYEDYEYILNAEDGGSGNTITLTRYNGTDTDLYVPAVAVINNVRYSTFLSGMVYGSRDIKNISFEKGVALSADASLMFYGCTSLERIDVSGLDTSWTTDLSYMFACTYSMTSIKLDGMDVSNVTNMAGMFSGCGDRSFLDENASNAGTLSWSGLQGSNVEDADYMFEGCGFQNIILEDMNLPNASTESMFRDCKAKKIDIENADLSNSTSYRYMFADCSNLITLNMKGVTSHKVTNMEYMFSGCENLKQLDISALTIENVTKFEKMFYNCKSIPTLDLSNFDFAKRWNISSKSGIGTMLEGTNPDVLLTPTGLNSLHYIPLESTYVDDDGIYWRALPTSIVLSESKNLAYDPDSLTLYKYTEELKDTSSLLDDFMTGYSTDNVYINGYNGNDETIVIPAVVVKDGKPYNVVLQGPFTHQDATSNYASNWGKTVRHISFESGVRVFGALSFRECENLEEIDFTGLDGKHLISMYDMFLYCANLKAVNFGNLYTGNVTNMESVFSGCEVLEQVDISKLDTHSVESFTNMFQGCSHLKSLKIKGIDTTNATSFSGMFWDCPELESIDISGFESDKVQVIHSMFAGCENVKILDMSGLNLSSLLPEYHDSHSLVLFGCYSLNVIKTPKDLELDIPLDTIFVDCSTNTEYTTLPKNLPYSITLVRKGVEYNGIIQAESEIQSKGIDEVVAELKQEDAANIEAELKADGAKEAYASIDNAYAQEHGITVSISSEMDEIDDRESLVQGAALNMTSGSVNIIIDDVSGEDYVSDVYNELIPFEMRAEATEANGTRVDFSKELDVPLLITLPIPTGMNTDGIKILHYGSDGTVEVITPDVNVQNRTVTFTVVHFSVFAFAQGKSYVIGDVNCDEKVNAADRIYLARYLAGWSGYVIENMDAADVNHDGKVNAADRIYLARYLAGWGGYVL